MDVGLSTQLTLDFLRIPSGTRGPEGPQGGFGKGSERKKRDANGEILVFVFVFLLSCPSSLIPKSPDPSACPV